ncbi:MAG: hypothetical protein NTZ78_09155 [Candidatus Aureabacteria bacterium]|nr:hypothetical protein [Candidatus Auribacterota bacterium]
MSFCFAFDPGEAGGRPLPVAVSGSLGGDPDPDDGDGTGGGGPAHIMPGYIQRADAHRMQITIIWPKPVCT